ncbi:MAG: methyltransferase domain-containing protein [bacterium]
MNNYVHGYSDRETERLYDQANSVRELLHNDTEYKPGCKVLEAGCGVGAQTVTLAKNSPDAQFVSIDISQESLDIARLLVKSHGLPNVRFKHVDIFNLPFDNAYFDHVFVCHALEHLQRPVIALLALRKVLKKGGSMTVIEGDHGSCYFHPENDEALRTWNCLIKVQARSLGNSLIGRQLFPLLVQAGFRECRVSPRMVYIDQSNPELMDNFVKKTIIPMVEGVKARALEFALTSEASWERGIRDLYKVAASKDGTFCYTFFKAVGVK